MKRLLIVIEQDWFADAAFDTGTLERWPAGRAETTGVRT